MFFASDNAGPVPQQVLDQMVSANSGYLPSYGADPQMEQVTRLVGRNLKHLMPQYIWSARERPRMRWRCLLCLSHGKQFSAHPCRTFTRMSVMRQNFTWVAAS